MDIQILAREAARLIGADLDNKYVIQILVNLIKFNADH